MRLNQLKSSDSDDEEIELADFKKIKTRKFYQKPMSWVSLPHEIY